MLNNKKSLKIITFFLIILLFFNTICFSVLEEKIIAEEYENVEEVAKGQEELNVNATSVLCFDRTSKRVIYEKNGYDKKPMASTTKIMTAIVTLENRNLNDKVTISKKAASIGGSELNLKAGDKVTLNDLLYGLLIRSRE